MTPRLRKRRRPQPISKLTLGVLSIATLAGLYLFGAKERITGAFLKYRYEAASPEVTIREHLPAFLEDRQILSKYDVFAPSKGKSDARKYMSTLLKGKRLNVPPAIEKQLEVPEWYEAKIDWASFDPDFEWLTDLAHYDFWDSDVPIEANQKIAEMDIPNYTPLIRGAKLLLLSARDQGDVEPALKEVRHLARLIWTNDTILSAMVSVSILKAENSFAVFMGSKVGSFKPIPRQDLQRAKRFFYAMAGALDSRLSDETWDTFVVDGPGQCLLANGAVGSFSLLRTLVGDDFTRDEVRLDRVFAMNDRVCRPTVYRKIWQTPEYPAWFAKDENIFAVTTLEAGGKPVEREPASPGSRTTLADLKGHPWVARAIGYTLLSIGTMDYFGQYKKTLE